jgi:transposase
VDVFSPSWGIGNEIFFVANVQSAMDIEEKRLGTIKRAMETGYCLCKGKGKVSGELALTFLACNLKRAITILGAGSPLKAFA